MARRTNMEELIHCEACGEDYSATYKHTAFKRVLRRRILGSGGNSSKHTVVTFYGCFTRVHKQETTRTVGVFNVTHIYTVLTK